MFIIFYNCLLVNERKFKIKDLQSSATKQPESPLILLFLRNQPIKRIINFYKVENVE